MVQISYIDFSLYLGLCDWAFTQMLECAALNTLVPSRVSQQTWWQRISHNGFYHLTRSKTSTLRTPVLWYIYALLSRSLIGRGDSMGIVSIIDLWYLYRMTDHIPIHLGYVLV